MSVNGGIINLSIRSLTDRKVSLPVFSVEGKALQVHEVNILEGDNRHALQLGQLSGGV